MIRRPVVVIGALLLAATPPHLRAAEPAKTLILATTTSTQDSGLLDVLLPAFERQGGFRVKTIAVGSGQALAMGQKGEADVLLVHSPAAEEAFVAARHGLNRRRVMHNDFVIVGPVADPARVGTAKTAADALKAIQASGAIFVSRGDASGTHAAEQKLWKAAGVNPDGQAWYQSTGLGMGQTLAVTSEKRGYALADRGTYLALGKRLDLAVLKEGDPGLFNVYHVIEVNPAAHAKVNAAGAKAFGDFMVSATTQKAIGAFGVEKFGVALFTPDADEWKATRAVSVKVGVKERTFTLAEMQAMPRTTLKGYEPMGVKSGPLGAHAWSGVALKELLLRADPSVGDPANEKARILLTSSDGWTATLWWREVFGGMTRGAALYNVKGCSECHGADAKGTAPAGKKAAPALTGRTLATERVEKVLRTGGDAHGGIGPLTEAQLGTADLKALLSWLEQPARVVKGDVYVPPPGREAILVAFERDGRPATGNEGLLQLVVGPDDYAGRFSHWVKSVELVR